MRLATRATEIRRSGLVPDLYGVHGGGAAQVYGRGRGRNRAFASRRDVRGVELGSHRVGLLAGVVSRAWIWAANEAAVSARAADAPPWRIPALWRLPSDGHGDDGARRGVLEHLHAGGFHEGAGPVGPHPSAPGEGVGRGGVGAFRLVIVCHGI